ncbi:MAG: hypothetical protein WC302_02125 [Candidatus Paceibacterota bacterium]|jgi:hypothetical protein
MKKDNTSVQDREIPFLDVRPIKVVSVGGVVLGTIEAATVENESKKFVDPEILRA